MQNLHEKKGWYQSLFPKGTRIEIVSLCNDEPRYPKGLRGIVDFIDDACQIHVKWENGGSIALLPEDGDVFRIVFD